MKNQILLYKIKQPQINKNLFNLNFDNKLVVLKIINALQINQSAKEQKNTYYKNYKASESLLNDYK